ncbi:peptide chain release factor N(5)-glutamine methyltransferase [soil metagenome]|jgi:release factor glutamine methyltransferase
MKTVKDVFTCFRLGLSTLYDANETEAITLLVVSEITGLSKGKIKAFPEAELSSPKSKKLENLLKQLQTGKPVQYVLGTTEFYGLPFYVNPSVLIPRPETEELVEWVTSVCNEQLEADTGKQQVINILDIGTGSGCIAISLKKSLPVANVLAIDISGNALLTAKQNAELNTVDINFIKADILNPGVQLKSHISHLQSPIALIVSNPPYVTLHDKTKMHLNVTGFEPHSALFVPEDDPLVFYKAIADFAVKNLASNGLLFFEINESLGKETVDLLTDKGFIDIELRKDMSGRDRMVKGSMK